MMKTEDQVDFLKAEVLKLNRDITCYWYCIHIQKRKLLPWFPAVRRYRLYQRQNYYCNTNDNELIFFPEGASPNHINIINLTGSIPIPVLIFNTYSQL